MYYRFNIDELPPVPQPFYAYGTGISRLLRSQTMVKKGGVNPFVEVLWGVEGVGELILFEQAFPIRPGDVFYYLPGETHECRSLCDCWNLRWLCFDGRWPRRSCSPTATRGTSIRVPRIRSGFSRSLSATSGTPIHCRSAGWRRLSSRRWRMPAAGLPAGCARKC